MVLDKVEYIDKFPEVFTLSGGTPVDLGIIGTLSISVHDSLLIATTREKQGFWHFFSLPGMDSLGRYLTKGRGPNEFISTPWVEKQYFFRDQGDLLSILYDFSNGKSYRMNISETLRDGKLIMDETDFSLPPNLDSYKFIDFSTILCKESNEEMTQFSRYILRDGKKSSTANFEKLGLATKPQDGTSGVLSAHMEVSPDGKRVVEAPLYLNHINLYSLDDSFGKTICFGDRIDNISVVQDTPRPDRMYTHINLNVFPEFFGVLYLNDTDRNFEEDKSGHPVLRFFDWDGKPLAEVRPDRTITTWSIDFANGMLYTLNYNTEEMYRYDIGEVLRKIGR